MCVCVLWVWGGVEGGCCTVFKFQGVCGGGGGGGGGRKEVAEDWPTFVGLFAVTSLQLLL